MKAPERHDDDIAIIGMAGLYAGARDIDAYWENILSKRCFITDAPEEWAGQMFDPSSNEVERIYTKKVGLLGRLAEFDPVEFGVVPNAVDASEPDHFLALKLAGAALRHAGYSAKPFDREKTGIILGRGATPNRATTNAVQFGVGLDQTMTLLARLLPDLDPALAGRIREGLKSCLSPLVPEAGPGLVSNVAVGRIANRFDLQGPNFMIDAACASSLIAVELAMKELWSGRCEMMLAGGVQASMPPLVYMLFCQLKALTRTAVLPFDQNAAGTALSEGVGFLVLKRRADAERDGDQIFAVIKAIGVASDGRAQGLLAPRVDGEILAIERAYAQCGVDSKTIGLVEAHGTGIPLGDRVEIEALCRSFGPSERPVPRCAVGSVKSMIGHCIPAAGIASLIKVSLALHHKILPPTLCSQVSAELPLDGSPFYLNTEPRPWIHGGGGEVPRRAAVNAFGFGGINAHAVLEEYPGNESAAARAYPWPSELLVVSAANVAALAARGLELRARLERWPATSLAGLACALSQEPRQACRLAIVATSLADFLAKFDGALTKIGPGKKSRLHTRSGIYFNQDCVQRAPGTTAFLFPGQGSQYPGMLGDLCMAFSSVRRQFDRSDAAFAGIWEHLPSDYIFPPPTCVGENLARHLAEHAFSVDVATETVFTASMALYELLGSFGLKCDVMLGHSSGEYAALAASGAVRATTMEEELELKRRLNRLSKEINAANHVPTGSLLTVGAVDPAHLETELAQMGGRVHLAMDNCPHQKILFGEPAEIAALAQRLRALGGLCQELPFNSAHHTPLAAPIKDMLLGYLRELPIGTPQQKLFSCSTCAEFPSDPEAVRETAADQWLNRVRFRETIERLHEDGVRVFIEVGPSSHLTSFVEDTLRKRDCIALASNERTRPGLEQLQRLLAQLYCRGFDELDFSPLYRGRGILPLLALDAPAEKLKTTLSRILNFAVPVLELDDRLIDEARRQGGRSDRPIPTLAPESASAPPPAPLWVTAEPAVPVSPQSISTTGALLLAHQELMQEFLVSQQQCMESVLARFNPEQNQR
jgi:acyl transferase domain-containing protein